MKHDNSSSKDADRDPPTPRDELAWTRLTLHWVPPGPESQNLKPVWNLWLVMNP